jgi:hypothetical protein
MSYGLISCTIMRKHEGVVYWRVRRFCDEVPLLVGTVFHFVDTDCVVHLLRRDPYEPVA